jgi:acyl carrier protein
MGSEILLKLNKFITKEILKQPDRKISSDEKLITSGLIDSLSLVDIALFIEETFQVVIDDTELNADTFDTIEELQTIILSRQHQ